MPEDPYAQIAKKTDDPYAAIAKQVPLSPQFQMNRALNASPTQFEVERQGTSDNPDVQRQATQTPAVGTMARMIAGDISEPSHSQIVPSVPGGLGIPGVHPEYSGESRVADEQRKQMGRGIPYRTAAALSPLAGVDANAVEHAGDTGDLGAVTGLTLPQAAMTLAPIASPISSEVADAAEAGVRRTGNATASLLRRPATAAESHIGAAGVPRELPIPVISKQLQSVSNALIPKGELGTVTRPGAFESWYPGKNYAEEPAIGSMSRLVVRPPDLPKIGAKSPLVVRPGTDFLARQEAQGFETAAKPAGRLVLTPAEASAEEKLSVIAARRARERGMQFAGGMVPREGRKVPFRPTILPPSE